MLHHNYLTFIHSNTHLPSYTFLLHAGSRSSEGAHANSTGANGSPGVTAPGLDLTELDRVTACLMGRGIVVSTHGAYRSTQNRSVKFCTAAGLTPFPATEQVLRWFSSYLKQEGVKREESVSGNQKRPNILLEKD